MSQNQKSKKKIAVLGAGLVGSLWSYLLTQQGYDVTVFEKRPHPDQEKAPQGRSINLVITSRGVHGLKQAGLKEKILGITVPVYGRDIHALNGDRVYQPYGRDKSECNYSVSRWDLNRALIRLVMGLQTPVHFGHDLSSIDLKNKKLSFKTTEGEKTFSYDILFATDGAGSVVRKALSALDPKTYAENVDWLSSDYKELSIPENKSFDPNALHIWPRGTHMMMGLSNQDGSMTLTTYQPRENHEFSFDRLKTESDVMNYFKNQFSDSVSLIPELTKQFLENPQGRLATVRMSKWNYQDSVVLIGDAAHAIVPFFGQGMNLGFEDCTTLFSMIKKFQPDSDKEWTEAFEKFDQTQRPNANAIAEMALENFIEMRDKVGQADFQAMKKIEALIEKAYPELYRSRYGLITYTLTPYQLAQEAGVRQLKVLQTILNDLKEKTIPLENLNPENYKSLIENEISAWYKQHDIKLESYKA